MTGEGAGQDGTVNPYEGEDCNAIVENKGATSFSVRIQQDGKVLESIPVLKGEGKKIILLKGQEIYLDAEAGGKVFASVDYEKKNGKVN